MLFSSWQFIFLFLPVTLLVFFLSPARLGNFRKLWLFATSLFFYGYWKVEYIPLLLFSIGFNYAIAEGLSRFAGRRFSVHLVTLGVVLNLSLLGYYKYTNFICDVLSTVSPFKVDRFNIELPLAISFFTFTQIGYLVDVYRDRKLHYNFFDYSLFVVFFPHLIAGPIVRHWEIIPQLTQKEIKASTSDLAAGWTLFLLGLFKKLFLADAISIPATAIFGAAENGLSTNFLDAWLGTIAFALQIYFDFSGYSDMAIGLARMFGIKFPCNFNSPYKSDSIVEFWKRWHITLTRFFREYLYFPLGGNRCGKVRQVFNIMITMLLSGLWHGAGVTFIIWGALHGFYLVVAHQWQGWRKRTGWTNNPRWYRTVATAVTLFFVLISWVYFKVSDLHKANHFTATMLGGHGLTMSVEALPKSSFLGKTWLLIGGRMVADTAKLDSYTWTLELIGVLALFALVFPNSQQLLVSYEPIFETVHTSGWFKLRLNAATGLLLGILFYGVIRTFFVSAPSPFLYFNF
jgi:alginate O-acetyltransferase complex protein AlgI